MCWDSKDITSNTATGCGLGVERTVVQFPAGVKDVDLVQNVQNGSGIRPATYSMGVRDCFPGATAARR